MKNEKYIRNLKKLFNINLVNGWEITNIVLEKQKSFSNES